MQQVRYWYIRVGHTILVVWWFVRRPHTQGVKCLIECQGSFLLVRLSYAHRRFTVPGGGVHKGETPLQAAKRELFEETGLELEELTLFGTYEQTIECKRDTVTCYHGVVSSQKVSIDFFEIAEAGWFSKKTLPSDCSPSVYNIISLYESFKQ